jgi:D-aminopeptidase
MSADAPKVEIDTGKLDALFAPFDRGDQPGLAVGVAHAGQPVYRRGFGLASVELPMVLTPTIRMRIGSTTKHFCALAIMLLAEEGKLSPEDSPRRVLPELPPWADAITLRQLMSHTSGMHCSLELIALTCGLGRPTPPDAQLKLLAGLDDVNFAPGTSYSYCNGGYVLLSEIVARMSGKPFSDFLQERILRLVGMHDTKLRPRDTDLLPNSATLHVARQEGGFSRGVFGVAIEGEGGLVSTIDDMLVWLAHMKDPVVGSPATWEALKTPARLANGFSTGYGLGLRIGDYRGVRTLHHAGGVIGGSSQMLKVVDHDLDVIIMTNRDGVDPPGLANGVIDACVPGLAPEPEPPTAAPVTGVFYSPRSGRAIGLIDKEGAQLVDFYPEKTLTRRQSDGALWVRSNPAVGATVRLADDGQEIAFEEFGQTKRLQRVTLPDAPDLTGIVGLFVCPAIGTLAEASVGEDGSATLAMTGLFGSVDYRLTPLATGLWSCEAGGFGVPLGGLVEVDSEGFRFSTLRTRRLRFDKRGPV